MLRVRIKMRSGASAAFPQNTTIVKGAGVTRSLGPRSITRGKAVLTKVCAYKPI
jgi:hypothetical protein